MVFTFNLRWISLFQPSFILKHIFNSKDHSGSSLTENFHQNPSCIKKKSSLSMKSFLLKPFVISLMFFEKKHHNP